MKTALMFRSPGTRPSTTSMLVGCLGGAVVDPVRDGLPAVQPCPVEEKVVGPAGTPHDHIFTPRSVSGFIHASNMGRTKRVSCR